MARVLVATQPWGLLWEKDGNRKVELPAAGQAASIDTTVYSAATGSPEVPAFVTNDDGELPGYVEEGSWTLTVGADSFAVEATSGATVVSLDATSTSHAADIAVLRETLNIDYPEYGGNLTTAAAAVPSTGGIIYIPPIASRRVGSHTITGKDHLTIIGGGSGSVLHNDTAGQHTLSLVNCDDLTIEKLRGQGSAGTLDAFHLENCQRAKLIHPYVQGSGRYGIYAQRCFGIAVDHGVVGVDSSSPYPTSVANCTGGLVLSWDGADTSSGCNGFNVKGGHYVIGKDRGWAVHIERPEMGVLGGPIAELSAGGILLKNCLGVQLDTFYGEFNPSAQEYTTGTVTATNGSATITGSGTAWSTLDGEGVVTNAAFGKWILIGGRAARILSVQSATEATLEESWAWTTATAQPYRIVSADLVLDGGAGNTVRGGLGSGAVILRDSSRNKFAGPEVDQVFFSTGSDYNRPCQFLTRRASSSVQDFGSGNWIQAISDTTGLIVREGPEAWREVGAAGQPVFEDTWVNEGSGTFHDAGFFKDADGIVHLKGCIKSGTLTNGAFTLPAGYRPLKFMLIPVVANALFGAVAVYPAGFVVPWVGNTTQFGLDGVSFRAEQ